MPGIQRFTTLMATYVLLIALDTGIAQENPVFITEDEVLTAEDMESAGKKIAARVAQIVGNTGSVSMGNFQEFGKTTNKGISLSVSRHLEQLKLLNQTAEPLWEVRGDLFSVRDAKNRLIGWRAEVRLVQRTGRTRSFEIQVLEDEKGANAILGMTGQVRPPPQIKLIPNPAPPLKQPIIENGWIRPSPTSAYAVKVLVKNQSGAYVIRQPKVQAGVVTLRLEPGEVYALQLWNGTQFDGGASVYIDGVSRYAISEDSRLRTVVDILPRRSENAGGTRLLKGYVKNINEVHSYKVFDAETAPDRILRKIIGPANDDRIGSIAVTFQTTWAEGDPYPPDEQVQTEVVRHVIEPTYRVIEEKYYRNGRWYTRQRKVALVSAKPVFEVISKVGSGKGPVVSDQLRLVQRNFGLIREVVKIYYYGSGRKPPVLQNLAKVPIPFRLGATVVTCPNGKGVHIVSIEAKSPASPILKVGYHVSSVNGRTIRTATDFVEAISRSPTTIHFVVGDKFARHIGYFATELRY